MKFNLIFKKIVIMTNKSIKKQAFFSGNEFIWKQTKIILQCIFYNFTICNQNNYHMPITQPEHKNEEDNVFTWFNIPI